MTNKMARKSQEQNGLPSIGDFFKTEDVVAPTFKPDQVVDRSLIMLGFDVEEGNFGAFVKIRCADPVTQKELLISTSMESIMIPLMKFREQIQFPCNFTVKKFGSSYQLA